MGRISVSCHPYAEKKRVKEIMQPQTLAFHNYGTKMIAHRGLSGLCMENTVPAFRLAGEHPYIGIETDVHRTRDGKFIIIHDDDTLRVTGQRRIVEQTDFSVLRSMKVLDLHHPDGDNSYQLPTLEEYLTVCREAHKTSVLEIKNHMEREDIDQIVDIVMEEGMLDRTIFISFDLPNLVVLRMRLPEQPIQLLVESDAGNLISELSNYQLDLDIYYPSLTQGRLNQLHNAGVKVNVWTVDDPAEAEKLSQWGVDYITTNILQA